MNNLQSSPCDELFDQVVQSLFGIGLLLEECMELAGDGVVREKLDASILELHAIIGRVRHRGDYDSVTD